MRYLRGACGASPKCWALWAIKGPVAVHTALLTSQGTWAMWVTPVGCPAKEDGAGDFGSFERDKD